VSYLEFALEDGSPEVYEAYSEPGSELMRLASAAHALSYALQSAPASRHTAMLSIWFPSCGGSVHVERISLLPRACGGHTFRYASGGWGVFRLNAQRRSATQLEVHVSVNTEKRAVAWQSTNPAFGPASHWKWQEVERIARRLCRKLRTRDGVCRSEQS
jgi:hypothetical protein